MPPDFRKDVTDTERALASAHRWGSLGSFFTLGLWDNERGIARAADHLVDARRDAESLATLLTDVAQLHAFLDAEIEENGVRVARCIFPDLALDGRQTYGPYWTTLRRAVLERDGYSCRHEDGSCSGPLQIHHIRHLSKGGTNDTANLLTLCRHHHGLQHPGNPHFTR